jgi:hypothetical protein
VEALWFSPRFVMRFRVQRGLVARMLERPLEEKGGRLSILAPLMLVMYGVGRLASSSQATHCGKQGLASSHPHARNDAKAQLKDDRQTRPRMKHEPRGVDHPAPVSVTTRRSDTSGRSRGQPPGPPPPRSLADPGVSSAATRGLATAAFPTEREGSAATPRQRGCPGT